MGACFLEIVSDWMNRDPQNIVAVHCKGGKGRTGSFIASWLLYSRECMSTEDALNTFALARTDLKRVGTLQTVDTPSQVRYVTQLHHLLQKQKAYLPKDIHVDPAPTAVLKSILFARVFRKRPPKRMIVGIHRF